jgi:Tol biopolymer transport system component
MNSKNYFSIFLFLSTLILYGCNGSLNPELFSSYIAYSAFPSDQLYLMDEDGNNNRAVAQAEESIGSIDWFPDTKIIAYTDNSKLKTVDLNSMQIKVLIDDPNYIVKSISVSPAGNQIAYQICHNSGDKNIAIVNTDGTDNKTIADLENSCNKPKFLPSADYIVFESAMNLFLVSTDGTNRRRITFGLDVSSEYSLSPDGSHVVFVASSTDLNTINFNDGLDNNYVTQYSIDSNGGTNYIYQPCWSYDGKEIAFVMRNNSMNQIYVFNLNTQQIRQISSEEYGLVRKPCWLPSGSALIFSSSWRGINLIKIDAQGKNRSLLKFISDTVGWEFCVSKSTLMYF